MSAAVYIDSLYRMGGNVKRIDWLKSTRVKHHPKIVHAFQAGARLSLCRNDWHRDALPFSWGESLPRYRVCEDCAAIVVRAVTAGEAHAQTA